ncbi:MAG TPA: thermonuclease family protein [Verrucomicrobiae bacterium]|nr:thermonuclease family protein [Verrucomicrobiae bacterium]
MTDGARRRPGRADYYTYLFRLVLPLAAGLTYAAVAGAQETTAAIPSNPYDGPQTGQIATVEDGQTLTLADGRQVRLVNILAPLDGEPLAADARKHLAGLALDRQIRWSYAGRRMDRYGRLLAYVHDTAAADGAPSLQAALVAAGLARVMGQPDTRDGLAPLLALEDEARRAGRGLWSRGAYRVRSAEANLWPFLNSVQIVEGAPVKLEHLKDRTYLNFGTDYTTDFTLTISARDRKLFDAMPWRLEDLIGRRLRIRGWLELRGGPLIEITYPEQIEVVE